MGAANTRDDYHWSYTDEPHASRRKEILAKYPQIKNLYGYEPTTKYIVTFWVVTQLIIAYLMRNASWGWIVIFGYCYGAVAAQALFLAMHEISHNLAFKSGFHNRLFGFFANITTVVPHFSMFVRYHKEHHQFQGIEGIDTDIPTKYEGLLFRYKLAKVLWVFLQIVFYAIRPLFVKPKSPGKWEAINWSIVIVIDILILYFWGFKSFGYLLVSVFTGGGLHPIASHFIAEHYVFILGQETYSYYGPLNLLCFNVGYHNEHHDFPQIPGSRLPQVSKIAPEYYACLSTYTCWTQVIWDYIQNPDVGPFSRVVRKEKAQKSD